MSFEILSQGFVTKRQPDTRTAVAAGSRSVVARNGDVVCTYMVQRKLGLNDFLMSQSRSRDGGITWTDEGFIWPQFEDKRAIFGSISRAPNGDFFIFGSQNAMGSPDEVNWCEETQGMLQNELFWARSRDDGKTWSEPSVIPMPIPGAAEVPGAMCIMRKGRWIACYAPYNTFDPKLVVDRNQIVAVRSDDEGKTWKHNSMIRFDNKHSTGAEAWVIELADGRLLGTTWHLNQKDGSDHPNAYAISTDGGESWKPFRSTGTMGQSTSLGALPDGRALFLYNQRKHGEPGVWLAVVKPTDSDFGIQSNEIIWRAQVRTQTGTSGGHSEWTDYSFGEPSVALLPDKTLLVTLWCIQPSGSGIQYVKLRMKD